MRSPASGRLHPTACRCLFPQKPPRTPAQKARSAASAGRRTVQDSRDYTFFIVYELQRHCWSLTTDEIHLRSLRRILSLSRTRRLEAEYTEKQFEEWNFRLTWRLMWSGTMCVMITNISTIMTAFMLQNHRLMVYTGIKTWLNQLIFILFINILYLFIKRHS